MKFRTLAFGFLLTVPLAALSQTTVFDDTLSSGSTINSTNPTPPTATATSYEEIASKSWSPNPPTLASGDLKFGIGSTSGGGDEIQALFTTSPVALQTAGQYIQVTATFTATEGILTTDTQLGMGLYNANQVLPWAGGLNSAANSTTTTAVTGGAQNWVGTFAQIAWQGTGQSMNSDFDNRPAQTNPDNRNQVTAVSGSSLYGFSNGSTFSSLSASNVNLTAGSQYAEVVTYTLLASGGLQINAAIYAGSPSGTFLTSIAGTNATPLTTTFDGFSMGFRSKNSGSPTIIDLNSLQIVTTAPYSGGSGGPTCIGQSVSSSSIVVGQTNDSVTVTLPSGSTTAGPLSVDLVSSDPAVAYVNGAPGGTLTLTFPANSYLSTNVAIVAPESGSSLFYITNATDGACINPGATSNLVTVACDPITISPNGSLISLVGQTDQLVTVSISPYANLTGPVTVNLISSDPSVVTPAGAVNGTLQLTFPANGPASQSVNLNALALGTATLTLNDASGPYCTSIATNEILTVTVPQPQGTNMTTESFSSAEEAAADGWMGYSNTINGEDYGWSDTANSTGGANGEAGGSFVRDTNLSYYADITVGPLTLNDYIYASGNLFIGPPSANAAFDICYFNTNNPGGSSANILGMGLADDGGAANEPLSRLSAAFGNASAGSGLTHEVFGPTTVTAGVIVQWSINYDPTAGAGYGQLMLSYNYEGTEYVTNVNLSASDRSAGANFNAFGMMVRGVPSLDITDVMGIYMSDLSYTKGYSLTPLSIPLQINATGSSATVTWANPAFSLEFSTNVAGPYQVIQGATSPYQASPSNAAGFYRLVAQ
jgi:hypothetical protein